MKLRSSRIVGEKGGSDSPIEELPTRKKRKTTPENPEVIKNVRQYPQNFIKFSLGKKNAIWYHPQAVWKQHVMKSKDVGRLLLSIRIDGIIKGTLYLKEGSNLQDLPNVQKLSGHFETFILKPEPRTAWWIYPGLVCVFLNGTDEADDGLVVAYAEVEGYSAKFVVSEPLNPSLDNNLFEESGSEDVGNNPDRPNDSDENPDANDRNMDSLDDDPADMRDNLNGEGLHRNNKYPEGDSGNMHSQEKGDDYYNALFDALTRRMPSPDDVADNRSGDGFNHDEKSSDSYDENVFFSTNGDYSPDIANDVPANDVNNTLKEIGKDLRRRRHIEGPRLPRTLSLSDLHAVRDAIRLNCKTSMKEVELLCDRSRINMIVESYKLQKWGIPPETKITAEKPLTIRGPTLSLPASLERRVVHNRRKIREDEFNAQKWWFQEQRKHFTRPSGPIAIISPPSVSTKQSAASRQQTIASSGEKLGVTYKTPESKNKYPDGDSGNRHSQEKGDDYYNALFDALTRRMPSPDDVADNRSGDGFNHNEESSDSYDQNGFFSTNGDYSPDIANDVPANDVNNTLKEIGKDLRLRQNVEGPRLPRPLSLSDLHAVRDAMNLNGKTTGAVTTRTQRKNRLKKLRRELFTRSESASSSVSSSPQAASTYSNRSVIVNVNAALANKRFNKTVEKQQQKPSTCVGASKASCPQIALAAANSSIAPCMAIAPTTGNKLKKWKGKTKRENARRKRKAHACNESS